MNPLIAGWVRRAFRAAGYHIEREDPQQPFLWSREPSFLELLERIEGRTLVTPDRCFALYQWVRMAAHLPGVVASCSLPPEVGAWSLAMIGLFNIVGSFGIGWAIGHRNGRWPMKRLLTLIYASRALAVLLFVLAPKNTAVMLAFAAVMGLTFLSTVPPTAGLVARFFGPAHMGTLFGLVMVTHQVGGFLGAYLGGKAFELTGRYDWMWWADIVLAVAAALLHWPIREARPIETAAARAA